MAGTYSRVLVHLRKSSQGAYEAAKFSECIFDHLGLPSDGHVECRLEDNRLLLEPPTSCSPDDPTTPLGNHNLPKYKIMHPPFCPVHHLDEEGVNSLPPEFSTRGVDVGVAVILESDDGQLLLTRRAAHMRTFPGVWVPPGGHVEDGETLEEAGLRELEEETGLSFSAAEKKNTSILGLWESVYPPILAMGHPKRHHIVVYLHVAISSSSKDLIPNLKLCPEEVDAAVWLSRDLVKVAVWPPNEKDTEREESESSDNEEIHITLVSHDGEHASGFLDASILRNRVPTPGLDIERISTGSRFALSLWLEKLATGDMGEATHQNLYKKYNIEEEAKLSPNRASLPELKNKM